MDFFVCEPHKDMPISDPLSDEKLSADVLWQNYLTDLVYAQKFYTV